MGDASYDATLAVNKNPLVSNNAINRFRATKRPALRAPYPGPINSRGLFQLRLVFTLARQTVQFHAPIE